MRGVGARIYRIPNRIRHLAQMAVFKIYINFNGLAYPSTDTVLDRCSGLEHQVRAPRRPAHLLVGAHPAVQLPLHRALRGRRRDRLVAPSSSRIADDQAGVPQHVRPKAAKQRRQPARRCGGWRGYLRCAVEPGSVSLPDGIEGPLPLAMPRHQRTCSIPSARRDVSWRSAGVAPGQPLAIWAACWMCMASRHAAKHDLLALGAADLGDEDLEGAHPIAAHRSHVAGVDAERDRARPRRHSRRSRRHQRRVLRRYLRPSGSVNARAVMPRGRRRPIAANLSMPPPGAFLLPNPFHRLP